MDTWLQESEFVEGFTKSSLMILVSEIGDKTFFIAAVMAMRHPQLTARAASRRCGTMRCRALTPRLQVLVGALGALWVMTALSAVMGWAAPALVRRSGARCVALGLRFALPPAPGRSRASVRRAAARRARRCVSRRGLTWQLTWAVAARRCRRS